MNKYNFYYDESEHSRKINHRTIATENYSDSFITVIVDWRTDDEVSLYKSYSDFEDKYKDRKTND